MGSNLKESRRFLPLIPRIAARAIALACLTLLPAERLTPFLSTGPRPSGHNVELTEPRLGVVQWHETRTYGWPLDAVVSEHYEWFGVDPALGSWEGGNRFPVNDKQIAAFVAQHYANRPYPGGYQASGGTESLWEQVRREEAQLMATNPRGRLLVISWSALLINLLIAVALVEFAAFCFRAWRRGRARLRAHLRGQLNRCFQCDYDLTGNTSGICPECGTSVRRSPQTGGGDDSRQADTRSNHRESGSGESPR